MYTYKLEGNVQSGSAAYQPGVCNIGPAEIARRRAFGDLGLAVTVALFAILVAIGAPHWTRALLFFPAAASASGYFQAMLHFCAGFGSRGVFNFGEVGSVQEVMDARARAADRRRSLQISAGAFAIGVVVAVTAVLLPF
jgi:hypothetical protein